MFLIVAHFACKIELSKFHFKCLLFNKVIYLLQDTVSLQRLTIFFYASYINILIFKLLSDMKTAKVGKSLKMQKNQEKHEKINKEKNTRILRKCLKR